MRQIVNIILIVMISCIVTDGFQYASHMNITGDGYLYANSNLGIGKDHVSAQGEQVYNRFYTNGPDRSLFVSSYNLTSIKGKGSRTYAFSSFLPDGLSHSIKMSSNNSTMRSLNSIDLNKMSSETSYQDATLGSLNEEVVGSDLVKPIFLAETRASGDIRLNSSLKTNATVTGGTDFDQLLNQLESVNMFSEIARVEKSRPTAVLNLDGKTVTVKGAISGSMEVGDNPVSFEAPISISLPEDIGAIKRTGVLPYEDIGDFRVIPPIEQALIVSMEPENSYGSVGEIENFTVVIETYGESTTLNDVSAEAGLPPGLDYIDSVMGGEYDNNSRKIKWKNIEPLIGDQIKNLEFTAKVNETAIGLSSLNISVQTEGTTTDGVVWEDSDIFAFPLEQPSKETLEYPDAPKVRIVSAYKDVGDYRILEPIEAEDLQISLRSGNINGSIGKTETFIVVLEKYGNASLNNISAAVMLPSELDYIESNGTYDISNKIIKWSNIGPMMGDQIKGLDFKTNVNETAIRLSSLNIGVYIEGTDANGETLKYNDTFVYKLNQSSNLGKNPNNGIEDENTITSLNEPDMRLVIKQASKEIDIEMTANDTNINELSYVAFTINITNSGGSTVENVIAEDRLPYGMIFASATPNPEYTDIAKGILIWNLSQIQVGEEEKLNFVVKFNGSNKGGDKLLNVVNVSADGMNKTASVSLDYSYLSVSEDVGDFRIIVDTTSALPEQLERVPLVRKTIHLGSRLVWDRKAYAGWMKVRKGDQYFAMNESERDTMRISYTPEH